MRSSAAQRYQRDAAIFSHLTRFQSRIALDADEERVVELKREMVGGQERLVGNPALALPSKEFEFTDAEVARIKAALQMWDAYGAAADRRWLEPIIVGLFDQG